MYKRQIYQIAELNRIEKIDSVARIESNRIETFLPELECSSHSRSSRKSVILMRLSRRSQQKTVYWILAASKGWIKQT